MTYGSVLGGVLYKVTIPCYLGKLYQGIINVIRSVITPLALV